MARVAVSGRVPRSGFSTTQYTGCQLWLKADAGITKTGSTVTAWADQSGTGNNFITFSGSAVVYTANAPNSLSTLVFDGSGLGACSAILTNTHNPYTIFLVQNTTTAGKYIVGIGDAFTGTAVGTAGNGSTNRDVVSIGVVNMYETGFLAATNIFEVWCVQYDGSNTTLSVNGMNKPLTGAGAAIAPAGSTSYIGGYGATAFFVGSLGEYIVYNSALSATAVTQHLRYLGQKWGVQIP
jgi:hypothetical protein